MTPCDSRGLTIIELLVVISIIGMLSGLIMIGINNERLKARDATIIQNVRQLQTLMEASYASKGDYSDWQPLPAMGVNTCLYYAQSWGSNNFGYACSVDSTDLSPTTCEGVFINSIKTPSKEGETVCKAIDKMAITSTHRSTLIIGSAYNLPDRDTRKHYSIGVYLPYKNKYLCIGSSGRTSEVDSYSYSWGMSYSSTEPAGCFRNP